MGSKKAMLEALQKLEEQLQLLQQSLGHRDSNTAAALFNGTMDSIRESQEKILKVGMAHMNDAQRLEPAPRMGSIMVDTNQIGTVSSSASILAMPPPSVDFAEGACQGRHSISSVQKEPDIAVMCAEPRRGLAHTMVSHVPSPRTALTCARPCDNPAVLCHVSR